MAIRVATSQPQALLAAIKRAIEQRHVETWEYDKDGPLPTPRPSGRTSVGCGRISAWER